MKKTISAGILLVLLFSGMIKPDRSEAQVMRDVMINTGAGTVTGAALGGATMALNNSGDLDPVRVGVGAGTLLGLGVGIYDAFTIPGDDDYYFDGVFASGRYRGTVILLDTFYGAATGALVGTAISLIGGNPVLDGLRIGTGAGAYVGFGFGLLDAFVIGEPVPFDDFYEGYTHSAPSGSSGLISMKTGDQSTLNLFDADLISYQDFSSNVPELRTELAVWLSHWEVKF